MPLLKILWQLHTILDILSNSMVPNQTCMYDIILVSKYLFIYLYLLFKKTYGR
jgi:hypothetical protein